MPAPADAEGGERPYDYGLVLTGEPGGPLELNIPYFTDCAPGDTASRCGGHPGRWQASRIPVSFCTHQGGRPFSVTAQQFRDAVRDAAAMWTATEAAIGIAYEGDCVSGSRWTDLNGINEVGFDDERNVVTGTAAAVAHGRWFTQSGTDGQPIRSFLEFDIIVDHQLVIPLPCFRSVIAHELGHALGFGHSTNPTDLMYPSFDPSIASSCPEYATREEVSGLQTLYGVNRAPTFAMAVERTVAPGAVATVSAGATDPDGDALSYAWEQVEGPRVLLTADGDSARFTAPGARGEVLRFRVTATDPYLHRSSTVITVRTGAAGAAPALAPSLETFEPGAHSAVLNWTTPDTATSYRFCSGVLPAPVDDCATVPSPSVAVDWGTVLGVAGSPDTRRILSTGYRATSLAACNAAGCSAAGVGPVAGGLRWPGWQMDYDVMAMAFDAGGSVRFTIGGAVNVAGPAREFTMYAGPPDDPLRHRIHSCGLLDAGDVCFAVLTPRDDGHERIVTVVSERAGTPTVEHRVTVR